MRRVRNLVAAIQVVTSDEIMLMTDGGVLVRTRVGEVSQIGRATQGVKLINWDEGEKLVSLERVDALETEAENTQA